MKTIKEVKPNTFIFEKKGALTTDIYREMIHRFEDNKDQQYEGCIGQQAEKDTSIKRSTDLVTSGKENWKELFQSLGNAIIEFRETHPFSKAHLKIWVSHPAHRSR